MTERQVDNSSWDGPAAMARCQEAACYRAICAGERNVGEPNERQHWALPHHKTPDSPPNARGVRNALARLSQTEGLKDAAAARRHLERHMSAIQSEASRPDRPPRDNLFRALRPAGELREADGEMPTMVGHFTAYNQWTEIDSVFEGHFLEQIASTAFDKTFAENRDNIRVLFNHGRDPQVGNKVLGPIETLRSEDYGPYYEVPLFDTAYNKEIIPGLRSAQYGASFRFRVVKEQFNNKPEPSDTNPEALPERTILEADVMEFGPVTFPAYAGATAGIRSLTDEFVIDQFTFGEGLKKLAAVAREKPEEPDPTTPPPEPAAATPALYQGKKRPSWTL